MPMRKRTLRHMPPETRKVANLVGELEGIAIRLKNLLPDLQSLEMMARAEEKSQLQSSRDRGDKEERLFE